MKKIDSLGLKSCIFQAEIFEASAKESNCSSKIFIRRFLNSDVAKRIDNGGMLFDSSAIPDVFQELDAQYGESIYGNEKFSQEELHWIGYIYRYWACITNKTSKQIYKEIKPDTLRKLYFPYHSLDPAQAIERIMEEYETNNTDEDELQYAVKVLRSIRTKKA